MVIEKKFNENQTEIEQQTMNGKKTRLKRQDNHLY